MRLALHPAICGWDRDLVADYCRYMGVTDLFYHLHDVEGYRDGGLDDPDALVRLQHGFREVGLRLSALNEFLPEAPARIESRCEGLLTSLEAMSRAGIETLIVFVLQEESDELWGPLESFYRALVPRAEELGLRIATHGHWSEGHIAYDRRTLRRIIDLAPLPANGICLCAGCCCQVGDDAAAIVREMPERIHCVHIRDTSFVGGSQLEELPLGAGRVPIAEVMSALRQVGYGGVVIPEHLSTISAQTNMEVTHAHAVGYLRGIIAAMEQWG